MLAHALSAAAAAVAALNQGFESAFAFMLDHISVFNYISVFFVQMLDYIRGPHVPPAAKRKLIEQGVWREFEEAEEDGRKISVDHIVPHDWGATE
eukprot:591228-Pelagomonas_calceolata.AAC.1